MLAKAKAVPEAEFNVWLASANGGGMKVPAPPQASGPEATAAPRVELGRKLYKVKQCVVCHTIDGAPRIGPAWKGLYGSAVKVVTNGKERLVKADDAYIRKSMADPNADVVAGYPAIMPPQMGILDGGLAAAILEFIKGLK
ncbi:MAG: c-type cytochrome [Deltaproteobacteria bacterium]|nr:c-type cytochrome [Deltaproteobacteria bacterium]